MRIDLPFPAKELWPNGRAHWAVVSKQKKLARKAAWGAAMAKRDRVQLTNGLLPIRITCYPKAKGPAPDRDNIVASAKAYIDGIADALGIDDKHFAAPTVYISGQRLAKFVIEVGLQVELAALTCKDAQPSS